MTVCAGSGCDKSEFYAVKFSFSQPDPETIEIHQPDPELAEFLDLFVSVTIRSWIFSSGFELPEIAQLGALLQVDL
jgi:hypothetical protein